MPDPGDPFGSDVPDAAGQEESERLLKDQIGDGEPGGLGYEGEAGNEAADQAETGRERI